MLADDSLTSLCLWKADDDKDVQSLIFSTCQIFCDDSHADINTVLEALQILTQFSFSNKFATSIMDSWQSFQLDHRIQSDLFEYFTSFLVRKSPLKYESQCYLILADISLSIEGKIAILTLLSNLAQYITKNSIVIPLELCLFISNIISGEDASLNPQLMHISLCTLSHLLRASPSNINLIQSTSVSSNDSRPLGRHLTTCCLRVVDANDQSCVVAALSLLFVLNKQQDVFSKIFSISNVRECILVLLEAAVVRSNALNDKHRDEAMQTLRTLHEAAHVVLLLTSDARTLAHIDHLTDLHDHVASLLHTTAHFIANNNISLVAPLFEVLASLCNNSRPVRRLVCRFLQDCMSGVVSSRESGLQFEDMIGLLAACSIPHASLSTSACSFTVGLCKEESFGSLLSQYLQINTSLLSRLLRYSCVSSDGIASLRDITVDELTGAPLLLAPGTVFELVSTNCNRVLSALMGAPSRGGECFAVEFAGCVTFQTIAQSLRTCANDRMFNLAVALAGTAWSVGLHVPESRVAAASLFQHAACVESFATVIRTSTHVRDISEAFLCLLKGTDVVRLLSVDIDHVSPSQEMSRLKSELSRFVEGISSINASVNTAHKVRGAEQNTLHENQLAIDIRTPVSAARPSSVHSSNRPTTYHHSTNEINLNNKNNSVLITVQQNADIQKMKFQEEIERLRDELQHVSEQLQFSECRCEEFESRNRIDVSALTEETSRLVDELQRKDSIIEVLRQDVNNFKNGAIAEKRQFELDMKNVQNDADKWASEAAAFRSTLAGLESKLRQKETEIDLTRKELQDTRNRELDFVADIDRVQVKFQADADALHQQNNELKAQINSQMTLISGLQFDLAAMTDMKNSIEEFNSKQAANLAQKQQQLSVIPDLNNQLAAANARIGIIDVERNSANVRANSLSQEIARLSSDHQQAKEEITALRQECDALKVNYRRAETDFRSAESSKSALAAQLDGSRLQIGELQRRLEVINNLAASRAAAEAAADRAVRDAMTLPNVREGSAQVNIKVHEASSAHQWHAPAPANHIQQGQVHNAGNNRAYKGNMDVNNDLHDVNRHADEYISSQNASIEVKDAPNFKNDFNQDRTSLQNGNFENVPPSQTTNINIRHSFDHRPLSSSHQILPPHESNYHQSSGYDDHIHNKNNLINSGITHQAFPVSHQHPSVPPRPQSANATSIHISVSPSRTHVSPVPALPLSSPMIVHPPPLPAYASNSEANYNFGPGIGRLRDRANKAASRLHAIGSGGTLPPSSSTSNLHAHSDAIRHQNQQQSHIFQQPIPQKPQLNRPLGAPRGVPSPSRPMNNVNNSSNIGNNNYQFSSGTRLTPGSSHPFASPFAPSGRRSTSQGAMTRIGR